MGLATSTQPAHGTVIQRARLLTEAGQARTLDNAPPYCETPIRSPSGVGASNSEGADR
jgi:hypothetical protein